MKRTSKYLGKQFGNWTCTHVGVAHVQSVRKKFGNGKSKRPGHCNYYYVMERRTSDNLADKIIRLSSSEAVKVYRGIVCVEEILNKREAKPAKKFTKQVHYCFD